MRNLLLAGAMAFALSACTIGTAKQPEPALAGATVKILVGGGHGSGSHIGDRYILTAAHVVEGGTEFEIKADDGSLRKAKLLWANKGNDVALLRLDETGTGRVPLSAVNLACKEPAPGDYLKLSGNPGPIEFISTYGRVAGSARKVGTIESAIVLDATVVPGMSGGGAFDAQGNLVGITVALMAVPTGSGASLMPVSYIVPASVICSLMARR